MTILFDTKITQESVIVGIDNATNYRKNVNDKIHDAGYVDVVPSGRAVEITVPTDLNALIIITIYIGDEVYTTMFLNQYMLFKAQNRYLANQPNVCCSDCDQKTWRADTLALLLRTRLLNYAYENNLLDDAINHYIDLTRVLSFQDVLFESIPAFYNNLNEYSNELF